MKIKNKVTKIREKMQALNAQLLYLQEECQHQNAVKENKSDTGNWCKADDCYWTECKCPDCLKFWREDQL